MRKIVHKLCVGVLLGSLACNLTGCMMMTDEQKTAVEIYTKKRTPSDMLLSAQTMINESNYLEMDLNYRLEKIDKEKSLSEKLIDGETWLFCALKSQGGGYWRGVSTRDSEIKNSEMAYVLKQTDPESSLYDLFITHDDGEQWVKDTSTGVWSGLTITSLDYTKLMNAQGLTVDKEPIKKDDKLQWKISGTLTYEEASNFLEPLEKQLKIDIDSRLDYADSVIFEMYMDTNNYPLNGYIKFNPGDVLDSNYIYTNWEVRWTHQNYDAYDNLTIPSNIQLAYITQEEAKEQENSFVVDGGAITIQTEAPDDVDAEEVLEDNSETSVENINK